MKPFLMIATRPEDEVARVERESVLSFTGLAAEDLIWARLDREDLPDVGAVDVSGVILCGSPFTVSDPPASRTPAQDHAEAEISRLLDRVLAEDIPFLGACYGIGTLGTHVGARIDHTYGEQIGAVPVTPTEAGLDDPLLRTAGLTGTFTGLVGHKEAVRALPEHATVLATGEQCPVQMFRVGTRQYATQFHPEMDIPALIERARAYRDNGYFDPGEMEQIFAALQARSADDAPRLLRAFVELFAR